MSETHLRIKMTKSRNLNAKYKFDKLKFKKGVPMHILADNPNSCRISLYHYAAENGFRVKTWLTDNGVVVLAY